MKTFIAKPNQVFKKWYVVDAQGQTLGRLCSRIASVLKGKVKPEYTPSVDTGDFVIVINADKVVLTGKKNQQKVFYTHSMYPGGLKAVLYSVLLRKNPERVLRESVKGMLPHSPLGRKMIRKLKIYRGSEHPHAAQKPEVLEIKG
ncbi:MAG: 50S ribosomal protein L13 [Bacillota bacterium]